jgi:metal-responsive CopG/Arc/MetJ family transcriptional regulator
MNSSKDEIITFKVDKQLAQAMKGIPNRSEFIRSAILAALDSSCPLCKGTGILTPKQREHWQTFARDHTIQECQNCHAYHIVCNSNDDEKLHNHRED